MSFRLLNQLPLLLILFIALWASAQVPIDPLVRPEEPPGHYTWRIGFGYTPYVISGLEVDDLGIPYEYLRLAHEFRLVLGGDVKLLSDVKAGVEVASVNSVIEEKRFYPHEIIDLSYTREKLAYAAYWEWRLDSESPWDPRVSLSFGDPWHTKLAVSASFIRDPVVLAAEAGFQSREEEPKRWFSLGLGCGFVANPWIRFAFAASLAVPISGVGFPQLNMDFRLIYTFDPEERRAVGVNVGVSLGEQAWLSLEAWMRGRGP